MKHAIPIIYMMLGGCSTSSFYPVAGAVVGAGSGALASPVGAVIGSGLGYGVGKGAQLVAENADLAKALTEKDVQTMLEAGMGKQKGFIDETMDTLYGILKLSVIGIALWNLVPIIYTRYLHKKTNGATNGNAEETQAGV